MIRPLHLFSHSEHCFINLASLAIRAFTSVPLIAAGVDYSHNYLEPKIDLHLHRV